jgi:cobyrinic acid a,c-diamide synthase
MSLFPPRMMIAALRGGSGKTILTLGVAAAWTGEGRSVAPFKKGPDFIDPGWLSLSAGRPCHNLDPFMMSRDQVLESFLRHSRGADVALVEGNRGLFDGMDIQGRCSSAELARTIGSPVVLIVDVTMSTRTVAALVLGCRKFDPALELCGIILNRVGGSRQESLVRSSVEHYCGLPVIGSVRKLRENRFPERHMGLVPSRENSRAGEAVSWARRVVSESLDLEHLWNLALKAPALDLNVQAPSARARVPDPGPRIGFLHDNAFWFYYPENLSALEDAGAELVEINAVEDPELPDLDGLYIGGGFPETQAEALAANRTFRSDLRRRIEDGLPVYAECGGLMYMGENLVVKDRQYPMVGALPADFVLSPRPQGHGYTILEAAPDNPFYEPGTLLRGHEFHYSSPVIRPARDTRPAFRVKRGRGLDGEWDGLCRKNLLGLYTHIHASGTPSWARRFVLKADGYRRARRTQNRPEFQKGD